MAKFTYTGPVSTLTTKDGKEHMLCAGAELDLPENDDRVKELLATAFLKKSAPTNSTQPKPGPAEDVSPGPRTQRSQRSPSPSPTKPASKKGS